MQSRRAKPLIEIHGQTMLEHVVAAVRDAGIDKVCIVVSEQLVSSLKHLKLGAATICLQHNQLGTGHALASAYVALNTEQTVKPRLGDKTLVHGEVIDCVQLLICLADTPALQPAVLADFVGAALAQDTPFHVIAMRMSDPHGYGRVVCAADGKLLRIVEERDADTAIRKVNLCNSGIMLLDAIVAARLLDKLLDKVSSAKQEYYLTDLLAFAPTSVHIVNDAMQFMGVNNLQQLSAIQEYLKSNE